MMMALNIIGGKLEIYPVLNILYIKVTVILELPAYKIRIMASMIIFYLLFLDLVSLFNGISTFMGYLSLKSFL